MSAKAKAKASPKAAVIISAPKASEILAILGATKDALTSEAILAANLARRESNETAVRLSSPDITAYIGSPVKYKLWDDLIETATSDKTSEDDKKAALARLGGWRFKSLIGRDLIVATKDGTNSKGRLVYRFKLNR